MINVHIHNINIEIIDNTDIFADRQFKQNKRAKQMTSGSP